MIAPDAAAGSVPIPPPSASTAAASGPTDHDVALALAETLTGLTMIELLARMIMGPPYGRPVLTALTEAEGPGILDAAVSHRPRPVKVLEPETIRQWCRACGRVTPTVTESNEETYCYVCHNGEDSPDDY